MSTETVKGPQTWQNYYTEAQAHRESMGRIRRIILPQFGIPIFAYLFIIPYSVSWLRDQISSETPVLSLIIQIILVYTAPIILSLLGVHFIRQAAVFFLSRFHNLGEDVDADQIIKLRLHGVPILPPPLSLQWKFPEVKAKNGALEPSDHWANFIGGPVKLGVDKGQALYLEQHGLFSRVVGQGSAFLHWDENIAAIVDVGPKTARFVVKSWTKDGIPVVVHASGEYFLGKLIRTEKEENVLVPFDPEAVKKAVEHNRKNGKEANDWINSAVSQTQGMVNNFIANKYLDQLFMQEESEATLLSHTNIEKLTERINVEIQKYGVCLSHFQIVDVIPPEKVTSQRKTILKASYENTLIVTEGNVKAHQIRVREKIRAERQRDLILTIANGLNRVDTSNFPEQLLFSISSFLDENIKDPTVRANLRKETLETLEKLQESIKFPLRMPGNEE